MKWLLVQQEVGQ